MKPALIYGAGQVAQVFAAYLYRSDTVFVVDREFAPKFDRVVSSYAPLGIEVVLFEEAKERFRPEEHEFVIGMSFKGLNKPRAEKFRQMFDLGYRPLTFVAQPANARGASIGAGSFIMEQNVVQPFVEIGENCVLWSGNHIGHHTRIGNHVFIASHAVIGGDCEIGDRCFIGVNATIRDGVKIGADCVIGAGALILSDCEPGGVYMGQATERSRVPSSRVRW